MRTWMAIKDRRMTWTKAKGLGPIRMWPPSKVQQKRNFTNEATSPEPQLIRCKKKKYKAGNMSKG
jgi:hypothetical protein